MMPVIDEAISFYEQSPTGQYDYVAVLALQYIRATLSGGMEVLEMRNRLEEIKRVTGEADEHCRQTKTLGEFFAEEGGKA